MKIKLDKELTAILVDWLLKGQIDISDLEAHKKQRKVDTGSFRYGVILRRNFIDAVMSEDYETADRCSTLSRLLTLYHEKRYEDYNGLLAESGLTLNDPLVNTPYSTLVENGIIRGKKGG